MARAPTVDIRSHQGPMIEPTLHIPLDPKFSGNWSVAGDINGDGELNIVSARNDDQAVTALGAYSLEGELLWHWGIAGSGHAKLGYDVPCQLYDLTGNGRREILLSTAGYFLVLDGQTGKEMQRFPLPEGLRTADCICLANLTGADRATDILIKSRYRKLWAFTSNGELLWQWAPRFGIKTCHYPTLVDLDGDGKDEVLAGHAMLDNDGTVLWKIRSRQARKRGHLDCARVVKRGSSPEEFRIVFTYCGANFIGLMDGTGRMLWSDNKSHFESIDVGSFVPGAPTPQFYMDVDHGSFGDTLAHIYDLEGTLLLQQSLNYGRQHRAVDWTGDGMDEIVIANSMALCKGTGERIGSFHFIDRTGQIVFPQTRMNHDIHMAIIDFSRTGMGDIMMFTAQDVCIYANPCANNENLSTHTHIEDINFTFY